MPPGSTSAEGKAAMPNVLTTAASVGCGHRPAPAVSGRVPLSGAAKLRVNGKPVVAAITGAQVIGCVPVPRNPPDKPCTTATANGGFAKKLKVNGAPALL